MKATVMTHNYFYLKNYIRIYIVGTMIHFLIGLKVYIILLLTEIIKITLIFIFLISSTFLKKFIAISVEKRWKHFRDGFRKFAVKLKNENNEVEIEKMKSYKKGESLLFLAKHLDGLT